MILRSIQDLDVVIHNYLDVYVREALGWRRTRNTRYGGGVLQSSRRIEIEERNK